MFEQRIAREVEKLQARVARDDQRTVDHYEHPETPPAVIAVVGLIAGHLATVEGRVNQVDDTTSRGKPARVVVIGDDSGELRVTFSRGRGTDIQAGDMVQLTGKPRQSGNHPIFMSDPSYRISEEPAPSG
jgi:RecG-like helicase